MTDTALHWTENSIEDFLHRIAFDFIAQVETRMESLPIKQNELAEKLNVTDGRVSQILNDPGNISLKKAIQLARAVGLKVALVAYDDNDPKNERGPINSEIFSICWERANKPADFWSVAEKPQITTDTKGCIYYIPKGRHGYNNPLNINGHNALFVNDRIEQALRLIRAEDTASSTPSITGIAK